MKVRDLHNVPREEKHGGTVSAWDLLTGGDFQSSVLFFNDNLVEPGTTIEPHEHESMEEVYYVISGTGRARVGDEETEVGEGSAVCIPPKKVHSLTNTGTYPLRFICFGIETARNPSVQP